MKKSISIAILSLFLLHLAGFYIYFVIRQGQIHHEMRSKLKELPADQLDVLHLSATEYKRLLRGDDEIEVNEKMYDIARVEIVNDKVMVYCLQDSSEDNLLSFLDQVVESATQDSQQAPSSLFQFSSLTFILPFVFSFNNQLSISICSFTNYAVIDCSFTPTLDTPPPRG